MRSVALVWFRGLTFEAAGFESCIHISEEASNASTAVPWAIVNAILASGVLGFGAEMYLRSNSMIAQST